MTSDLVESFSGIRGIWGRGLSKELALKYGLSFARLLRKQLSRKPALIIGYDTRSSSKEIAQLFKLAFSFEARKIIDAGITPTAVIELGARSYKLDGGIVVSGSHSPKEFNGWKLLDGSGAIISPAFLKEVIDLRKKIEIPSKKTRIKIISRHHDLQNRYLKFLHKMTGKEGVEKIRKRGFKIVIDPNGGAAIPLIRKFLSSLGVEGYYLNMEIGKFARKIEPDFESLAYLREIIKTQGADFGVGFDCDADRAEIVLGDDSNYSNKHGYIVNGQYILALSVDEVLSSLKNPQGRVVVTNDCTSVLIRKIAERYRAKVKEVEVGEINVVGKMDKENSPVGGEGSSSGAIISPSRCRDGFLSLAMILRHLVRKGKRLSDSLEDYPDFFSVRDKLQCPAENQIGVRENVKFLLKKQGFKIQERGGKTGTVKALVEPDSFIFFRASKTEPGVFRVIVDAPDLTMAKKLLEQGVRIFNKAKSKKIK